MADVFFSTAQGLRFNNRSLADTGMSDVYTAAPLLTRLGMIESNNGDFHAYTRYDTAPSGAFRAYNTGIDNSVSADVDASIGLKVFDTSWFEDKMKILAYAKGDIPGFMARESGRHLVAGFAKLERQVIYGTTTLGDSAGFAGFANESDLNNAADSNVVNAGGSAALTSVYLVCSNAQERDISLVVKGSGLTIEEYYQTPARDGSGKVYEALRQPIHGMMGLIRGQKRSIVRIANIGTANGTTLTDDRILSALELMETMGAVPDFILGNARSRTQLQRSRVAVNAFGTPSQKVVDAYDVPWVTTPNILNTETALA